MHMLASCQVNVLNEYDDDATEAVFVLHANQLQWRTELSRSVSTATVESDRQRCYTDRKQTLGLTCVF